MNEDILSKWKRWDSEKLDDSDLEEEMELIRKDAAAIKERFYRDLEFGTGGLRGVIGVGTNRMNVHTVARVTQGYSNYLNQHWENASVAIAYDSRIKSVLFAKKAAEVLAANGIKVYIYPELMPTPALSFAVRYLKCTGGIVITASHNPSEYNGYKVYGRDGCQITSEVANSIISAINVLDTFVDVWTMSYDLAMEQGKIVYIDEDVVQAYCEAVSNQSLCKEKTDRNLSIVYTPLNGSGLKCVLHTLEMNGFHNIFVVEEQKEPNGKFPTCPYPNPEMRETLKLGLRDAEKNGSELLLATDPDCDRVGIAIRHRDRYAFLSGNEVGVLLFDYICKRRIELGRMPKQPILLKTIVTTDMAKRVAAHYGVQVVDVLTGFKYIGEQIGLLEKRGEEEQFIFGFEESYGYLTGGYVRDKDGVNGSLMICEMCAYYKKKGLSLVEVLNELYEQYGYCLNTLHSYTFEGVDRFCRMKLIMGRLRENAPAEIGGLRVEALKDYQMGVDGLPKSDVLKFFLDGNSSVVVRPSGTEPKIKIYLAVNASNRDKAMRLENRIVEDIETWTKEE